MKTLNTVTKLRDLKELREELRDSFTGPEVYDETTPEHAKFNALKEELKATEKAYKDNEMYLFIEGQNLVHKRLNKVIPEAQELINGIIGEKYLNADTSVNYKHKNHFDSIEAEEKKDLKNYTYRITTKTRISYSSFIIDVCIRIWNENGSQDYENCKYLGTIENGTSFKEVYEHNEDNFKTYKVKAELKKLNKYQAEKKKLDKLKKTLNSDFMKKFAFYYDKDKF